VSIIPGRIHEERYRGRLIRAYHRADGALIIHGRRHSEYSPQKDRQHKAQDRPGKAGYPHAGDGRPIHTGLNRPLAKQAKAKKTKKGGKGKKR